MRHGDWPVMTRPQTMASREASRCGKLKCTFARLIFVLAFVLMFVLTFVCLCNLRNGGEQRTHQPIEFRIGDEMRRVLSAHRSAEHARKTQHRSAAAGETPRRVV